jgi:PDZ domain-containing protein
MNRRAATLLTGSVLLAALIALSTYVRVGYSEVLPGPTYDTLGSVDGSEVITITGGPTHPTTGQLRMLTIYEQRQMDTFEVVKGWLDGSLAVLPTEVLFPPGQTEQQINQEQSDEFQQSQSAAAVVALREAGYPVQVYISKVVAGQPADGHLTAGDVITSIDGQRVLSSGDVGALVQGKPAGSQLVFDYVRAGKPGTTTITSTTADGRPRIGVEVGERQPSPIKISFKLENVGGPSAGLMFTLGAIAKLQGIDLTGGKIIAGTGTMDEDGNVGPIGGIHQKMVAAYDSGARIFLAPADNCQEAASDPVPGLKLVKVDTVDTALAALQQLRDGQEPALCTK